MNHDIIQHRDQVLRAYFQGRNWDKNNEFLLKRELVLKSSKILPQYPYLIDDEWEVEASRTEKGRGDLVFTDGTGRYAVVEVKWIDLEGTARQGRTKRVSNKQKRKDVKEQALKYAAILLGNWEDAEQVEAFVFTNECDQPKRIDTLKKQRLLD
jgi:hypothetical protein